MIKEMFNNKKKDETELGFGTKNYQSSVRFLNRDGSVNIKRKINGNKIGFDIYHYLITISWFKFISLVFISYIVTNTLFAIVYFLFGIEKFGGISEGGVTTNQFMDLFFFSAQTLTTVGYGHVFPNHVTVSSIAAVESMLGLMGFALVTGLLYGRFSRPKADVEYSENAVIAPYQGITAFMFRIANRRQNELIENECQVALAINNKNTQKREFHFLNLERTKINFLAFSWTIVHPIDETSPIYGLNHQDLIEGDAEFIILFKAINDTYSQNVFSRISYKAKEIVWDAKFTPIKQVPNGDGSISINVSDIHIFEKTISATEKIIN